MDFQTINKFIDQHREDALWFSRKGFYPSDIDGYSNIMNQIKSHCDMKTFVEVRSIEKWLSRLSNKKSAI
jgi:hypothetical protein